MIEEEIRKIVREELHKHLKALLVAREETVANAESILTPVAPKPKPRPQPQEVMVNEEEAFEEPEQEGPEEEPEWIKEQDGNLEKGETQIWRYGEHTLTVWTEGKKYYAQTDGEKPEILWKQSDLVKIQKRIEGN